MTQSPTLLSLPPELRLKIYSHLLISSPDSPLYLPSVPLHPCILSTCRLLHHEALSILYTTNTYLAHPSLLTSLPRLRLNYRTIPTAHLISLIRKYHLRVRLDCDPGFTAEKATEAFTGVEELTIEVFQAQFGSSGYGNLRLLEGVRRVRRCKIVGSVSAFQEYVDWLRGAMMAPVGAVVMGFGEEGI